MKCEICKGEFDMGEKPDSKVVIEEPGKTTKWIVCDVCAASVYEFILEYQDDVKTSFRDQDEAWKLRHKPEVQKRLEGVL